jgi:hemoglobin/transferrin/lactoferrin receptor protein
MKKIVSLIALAGSFTGLSQTNDSIKNLEEVKLETQRYITSNKRNPQQIQRITQKEIEFGNFQTTAEMLSNSGKLFVQKSQQGGGSPVIRGFESSRILLLVDGVRMNNLIYRGGHLQNVITVDENMLENTDILFGSTSTPYGSDAMGGAINLITKKPLLLNENNGKAFSSSLNSRYATVNKEKSGYFDFRYSGEKWATLTAVSYNDFGDLKMGKKTNGHNDFFGLRPFYVETVNGVDNIVANPDPYVQKFSGYKQYNAMQKVLFKPNETTSHNLNLQFSTTSDIPRYDRLTDIRNGNLRYATWNYGPQKRILAGYKFTKDKAFLNSDLSVGANYQDIEESRINRSRNNPSEETRIEKVKVYSINADLKAKIGKGELLYGVEAFYDDLNSTANAHNIQTGANSAISTRYPDGKNFTLRTDAFATYFAKINESTSYNLGARAGYTTLSGEFKDKTFFPFPFNTIEQKNITYSASVGIVNNAAKTVKLAFNVATGFRTPNIDDLAKVFETTTGTPTQNGTLYVPNPNIKPEKNITGDLGITIYNDTKTVEFENIAFYTRLFDVIAVDRFTYNGQSTVDYNGYPADVYASQNRDQGYICGYSTSLKWNILKEFKFYGSYNFTYGRVVNEDKTERPLDHIPPHYGKVGFNFENKWLNLDLNMLYNGKKHLKDYSSSGEDNLQYAPAYGMPAWQTYNFKAGVKAMKALSLYAGVENILDIQYRIFASGINAPGRNIYFGTKINF